MISQTSSGLKFLTATNGNVFLFFNSSKIKECIDFLLDSKIENVIISPEEFKSRDLNFLYDIKDNLKGLSILGSNWTYTVINQLHNLTYLGIPDNKKDIIDFVNFPGLTNCGIEFSNRIKNLKSCSNLKNLTLSGYKSLSNNLENFPSSFTLENLSLIKSKISSLDGIQKFNALNNIELFSCKELVDINSISSLCDNLISINFEKCVKIRSFKVLEELLQLKKLIITDCGKIENIQFLSKMENLNFFSFWGTNIIDGDISPCDKILYVGFDDRKHYNRKMNFYKVRNSK